MALWGEYDLSYAEVYLVVTVGWSTTQAGAIMHTDTWRYDLTDPAVVKDGAQALADRIVRTMRERAQTIDRGVKTYQQVQTIITVPENTRIQIIP